MAYYLEISSPETYESFLKTPQDITGFRLRQSNAAKKIKPGDKFICYMTKLSRWIGILGVLSESYVDSTPRYYDKNDPFVVRFRIKPLVWLPKEQGIPIREDFVWDKLSFTKGHDKHGSAWTGLFRGGLHRLDDADGKFLETILLAQVKEAKVYPVDEIEYRKWLTQRVKGPEGEVTVSVPVETISEKVDVKDETAVRESMKVQALVAQIGEKMGFKIWVPRNDRSRVLQEWKPESGVLIDELPLSYDQATLKTIEQIDVLWLRRRSIVRAFEVEQTTSIYSGILRMADLLALQPNMDIKLHLVAPANRRDKVFEELQRPVFSLLERGPLAEACTFISYDSLYELAKQKHLSRMSDSVLEDYEENAE
jgi:predicted RNA-binding protein